MDSTAHLKTLGKFLSARRSEVSPDSVPQHVINSSGRRRVPGLRREEVAQLAAVSADYYTRVEQGRLAPSPQVLSLLSDVYRFSPEQRVYAEDLLNRSNGVSPRNAAHNATNSRLQMLMEQLTDLPALVFGPRLNILLWNHAAARLLVNFSELPVSERNYIAIVFTDPRMKELYEDWETVARTCVGVLRREAVANPEEEELATLVGKLSIASEEFRRWWAEHRVAEQDFGAKVVRHPEVGTMRLNWDSFTYQGAERQQLVLWSAEKGSPDAAALAKLAE